MRQRKQLKALASLFCASSLVCSVAIADEIVVKNDSLAGGSTAAICPCFTSGEEAAVWLTSPCDGNIVGIQVFWRSLLGGTAVALEDSLIIYEGGVFPNPGSVKDSFDGPVMNDGVLNEFRAVGENGEIPISVPVTAGEEFVVSFRFANTNNTNVLLPSIVSDNSGCLPGKNAIKINGTTWSDACAEGVSGNWVIRAVIDCTGEPTGSICLQDGSCEDNMTEEDAITLGAVWNGSGSTCADTACVGACYIPTTDSCVQFTSSTCELVGGEWQGPGTDTCGPTCAADLDGSGSLDFFDVAEFLEAYAAMNAAADFNNDGEFNFFDVAEFLEAYAEGCP